MNDMSKIEGKARRMTAGSARAMLAETFSESFSKWVRNGSSLEWSSYLILFEKSHILAPKTGHEPPDSVSSHHFSRINIISSLSSLSVVIGFKIRFI